MILRSMTAYAGAERELGIWRFAWEIRSVNHRYLDLNLRLPDLARFMEADVRALIGTSVKRGRLDVTLTVKPADSKSDILRFDPSRVTALLAAVAQVEDLAGRALGPISALDILRWPEVLHEAETDRERLLTDALIVLDQALGRLVEARESEGRQLLGLITPRLTQIAHHVEGVRGRMPEVQQALRQKIMTRLAEVSNRPDADRLEQELVYLAQKMDVAEELDRLDAHVREMRETLGKDEPMGRRLDFLSQEMNREANTLASKSVDVDTTRAAVEIKVLIEQIREQIQNIE